jgi:phosphatidylethanolamine/phosphatidyl-N-methylethanolamine N-methyltransferase
VSTHKGLREFVELLRQTARDYYHTGSIAPSSRALSQAVAEATIPRVHPPRRILEIGPGTGPVSRALAERLLPGDSLTLYEINADFVRQLEQWRNTLDPQKRAQIEIFRGDVMEHDTRRYHHIVSALPFNNFHPALVERFFQKFHELSLPQGTLTMFEYLGSRVIKGVIPGASRKVRGVGEVVSRYVERAQIEDKIVWRNLPPARVRRLSAAALAGEEASPNSGESVAA